MIELLVVIAIIGLLVSILLPCLQRVRGHAKAVGCQANLRQWGVLLHSYAADDPRLACKNWWFDIIFARVRPTNALHDLPGKIILCPMTTENKSYISPDSPEAFEHKEWWQRQVFTPWGTYDYGTVTSYGANLWLSNTDRDGKSEPWDWHWQTFEVHGAVQVPVLMDCLGPGQIPRDTDPPPEFEDVYRSGDPVGSYMCEFCINRHDAGVNALFLDWSVRKVGLKELWTLKWHRQFNTHGAWTKRGGVRPEDWPAWMRRFKDY